MNLNNLLNIIGFIISLLEWLDIRPANLHNRLKNKYFMKLKVETHEKREVIDITDLIEEQISNSEKDSGVVLIFVTHTTAAIATADLDPGTDQDYLKAFEKLIPNLDYNHPHNPAHMPDHILGALIGPSLIIPFENQKLILGTWQRIILLEFDGPRDRNLIIRII